LLQHAENPVDWYPWGPEALALAKELDRPIFLSIGYAACHWCHVMAHESFEDPQTAALMNEHFVNIKVDREERPDIDSLYMDAVVAMTGHGGWPMSVFLTPDGQPFYGGTYFPPERRFNLPSLSDVLQALAEKWAEDRQELLAVGGELTARLAATPSLRPGQVELDEAVFDAAAETLFRNYDWTDGGWGAAPKFPQPMAIEFLFRRYARSGDRLALDMAQNALKAMAGGGINDQLAGGFARYSVDAQWLVPHFEKMLYDNAQLALTYLHGWQLIGDDELRWVAEQTLDFMLNELRHTDGGLFSSYDADSEGEEGKYYVWSQDELSGALEHPELVIAAYGVTESGNFEGKNILHRAVDEATLMEQFSLTRQELGERLDRARSTLLDLRRQRVPPGLDDKVLTSWNGLALIALAEAARATGEPRFLEAAQKLAAFLLEELIVEDRLLRSWRDGRAQYTAYLEDHAALGLGLLALYQADFDLHWYRAAVEQAEEILANFTDSNGGFFDTRHDHEQLIARPKSIQDSPTPSGNTLACTLLLRLAAFEGESRYAEPAEIAIRALAQTAAQHPTAFSGWLCAMDFAIGPQLQLALSGPPANEGFQSLLEVANQRYYPNLILAGGPPSTEASPMLLLDRPMQDNHPTAYLCEQFACQLPTTEPEVLAKQLSAAVGEHFEPAD
jgi:uncharacterized protein YyaL (SSP411 family)